MLYLVAVRDIRGAQRVANLLSRALRPDARVIGEGRRPQPNFHIALRIVGISRSANPFPKNRTRATTVLLAVRPSDALPSATVRHDPAIGNSCSTRSFATEP